MMHIVACIKQVPDTTQVRVAPETNTLIREGIPTIVNPYDVHAIEEAVRLKERYGGKVTVISMGPPQAREALQKALSMGADDACLLSDGKFAGADTLATSYALAEAIRFLDGQSPVDLVICGKQTIDGDTAQVGPGMACRLGYSQLTYVDQVVEVALKDRSITARRHLEGAYEIVCTSLPAVITVVKEINEPRYASLPNLIRALEADIPVITAASLKLDTDYCGLKGSPTKVKKIFPPPRRSGGAVVKADRIEDVVAAFMEKIQSEKILTIGEGEGKCGGGADGSSGHASASESAGADPKPGEVWVFVETDKGVPARVSWELLGVGRTLANDLGTNLCAVVPGYPVGDAVSEAVAHGADVVYAMESPVLAQYRTVPFTKAIVSLVKAHKPDVLLMGATTTGRDLASAVATELATGLTADCTGLAIGADTKFLEQTRPAFGGNIMATILTEKCRPQMSTVRPRVMAMPVRDTSRKGRLVRMPFDMAEDAVKTKIIESGSNDSSSSVNLVDAEIIVSGGRGMGAKENFKFVRKLAEALGGVVGASRAAVDAKWMGYEHQVGQTGKTVRPRLYIACGISGAVQHLVGMQTSDMIIAINRDPNAPIFSVANLGIVGNVLEIMPALTDAVYKVRSYVGDRS